MKLPGGDLVPFRLSLTRDACHLNSAHHILVPGAQVGPCDCHQDSALQRSRYRKHLQTDRLRFHGKEASADEQPMGGLTCVICGGGQVSSGKLEQDWVKTQLGAGLPGHHTQPYSSGTALHCEQSDWPAKQS